MSPADERRQLVLAAQRREPFPSDEWVGAEPGLRSAVYADKPAARRGLTFVAVSAGLVAVALGVCWLLASSESVAQWIQGTPGRTATTELTSAPATPARPVDVATLPNAVPTTVQPAMVPAAPPVLEESPKAAPAMPVVAATAREPITPPSLPVTPVQALPAAPVAVHHEPAGQTTIRVVETPDPEPTPSGSE